MRHAAHHDSLPSFLPRAGDPAVSFVGSFAETPRPKISDNNHFLVTETGAPFFWLGDTAWELFHRLNREDAERYLQNRAKLDFAGVKRGFPSFTLSCRYRGTKTRTES